MKKYKIPTTIEITNEDLDNIVDSAINYCSYWCDLLEYGKKPTSKVIAMSEALSHGGTLVFHIDEPYKKGGETKFELTTDKLLKGITDYRNFDFEQFDGPMSDAVLQMALFGEVIYA
jgi:hypothetical protein